MNNSEDNTEIPMALAYDDVLISPAASEILPSQAKVHSRLTNKIALNIPLISAAMDTVTESGMAIAMAQNGGLGVIHKNLPPKEQASQVRRVKRFEAGMVIDPVTVGPDQTLSEVKAVMETHGISGLPVVEKDGRLVGILTNRDMRFAKNMDKRVRDLMTSQNLATISPEATPSDAKDILQQRRIERLVVTDDSGRCVGLVTVKDMEKAQAYPLAVKDSQGRLLCAAAVGVGDAEFERAKLLIEAGVDALFVDTAHGHSAGVLRSVANLRDLFPELQIIAGNVAVPEGALALIKAGADCVKVGIGPGSICTTRIVAGVGVPQFSAVKEVAAACKEMNIPTIADGGIRNSGDIVKALGVGADMVMVGSLLAGCEESPGETFLYQGRTYKSYRGMGSLGAMAKGSADRYFQGNVRDALKLVPEGIEGQIPYKGMMGEVIHQLIGGLRAGMGYVGAADLQELKKRVRFRQITNAGLRESHVHDVSITRESPNYRY